jgi:formate-dependent phosphoribosylglycinamide formyltransferase (GAR transformylase)
LKVLLLDSAFSAVPIHDYLTDIGCEVWTIGNRINDPLAVAYPERWIKGDYSDTDLIKGILERNRFDVIVPGCTDVSMETYVSADLQPHYHYTVEADHILSKKPLFRNLCEDLGLSAPRTVSIDNLPDSGCYICKPADSFSGRGVVTFDSGDRSAAAQAIVHAKMHSPTGQVVCEEFVEGQLYSYSAFVDDGIVDTAFIVREGSRYDPFSVDTSYVLEDFNPTLREQLQNTVEAVCRRLGLCDGLLHTQFIDRGDRIFIIEMTRRCPGDLYSNLIEYSTGYPYAASYASYFIGQKVEEVVKRRRFILRHTIKQKSKKSFRGFDLDLGVGLFNLVPTTVLGERIDPRISVRTGIAFLEMKDQTSLEERYLKIVSSDSS